MRDTEKVQQDELESERQQVLLAMMGNTERAPEPGTLRTKDVIHAGDDAFPMPVVAGALSSAGYTYIYDTRTGERSVTNNNMLPTQMRKRRLDGSLVFSLRAPVDAQGQVIQPARGSFRCLLHPDARTAEYDLWRLPICPKANLMSLQDVEDHMRHRHAREWRTIEKDRERREKIADRERQEEILLAIAGKTSKKAG